MEDPEGVDIVRARSSKDVESTAALFASYAKSLGIDLSFQDFDVELTSLPGKYAICSSRGRDSDEEVICSA